MTLASGSVLANRYRIERLLGSGGMGAVYRAYDTQSHRTVAIKENIVAIPGLASDVIEARRRQFEREAAMLSSLHHPNIPGVLDHFSTSEGNQYLVMDFIEGDDMAQIIAHKGRLPEADAIVWVGQVCDALEYLHSQNPPVVHRDVKPQNIKVTSKGQVYLVDFGIAKLGGVDSKTTRGALSVTQGFSPPEQYAMTGTDARSDIYSLGATLYALLTGQVPPDSISLQGGEVQLVPPREMNEAISPAVQQAVLMAMETRRSDRPQTVSEFWRMLTAGKDALAAKTVILTGQGIRARARRVQRSLTRAKVWGQNHLSLVLLGVAGIAVLAVALSFSLSKLPIQRPAAPTVTTPSPLADIPTVSPVPTTPPATTVEVALHPPSDTPTITVELTVPTNTPDSSALATQRAVAAIATQQTANLACDKIDFQILQSPGQVESVAATDVELVWRVANKATSPSCKWGQAGQELQILRAVLVGGPSASGTPVKLVWVEGDEYDVSLTVRLVPGTYPLGWKLFLPNMETSDSPILRATVNVVSLTPKPPPTPMPTVAPTPCPIITYPCHCHQECVGRVCTTICDEQCTREVCGTP